MQRFQLVVFLIIWAVLFTQWCVPVSRKVQKQAKVMYAWVTRVRSVPYMLLSIVLAIQREERVFPLLASCPPAGNTGTQRPSQIILKASHLHSEERCRGSRFDFFSRVSLLLPEWLVLPIISVLPTEAIISTKHCRSQKQVLFMFDVEKIQRQLVNNGGLRIKMSDVKLLSLTSILLK